jgi:hypothetical protein
MIPKNLINPSSAPLLRAALTSTQPPVREAASVDVRIVQNASGPRLVSVSGEGAIQGEVGSRIDAVNNPAHRGSPRLEPATESGMDVVTLPDGSRYPLSTVRTVWMNLEAFVERTTAIDTYELHQKCLNPNHEMFGRSGQQAEEYNLTSGGRMHDDVRSIILASLHGDGLEWELKNPLG